MYATDFEFNGELASEHGLMVCTWGDESDVAEGGNIEPNVIKPPNRDTFDWYGGQFNNPLVWNVSVAKLFCDGDKQADYDQEVSIEKEREIARWLMKPGYKWTRFLDDRDGGDELWYKCNVTVTPYQVYGVTIGFDLVFTSNCAYGFTDEQIISDIINSSTPLEIGIDTDINEYVYPSITLSGKGEVELYNENDLEQNLTNAKQTKVRIRNDITNEVDIVINGNVLAGSSNYSNYISSPTVFEKNVEELEDRSIQVYQNITASISPDSLTHIGLRIIGIKQGGTQEVLYTGYDEYIDLMLANNIIHIAAYVMYWHNGLASAYVEQFNCNIQVYNKGTVTLDSDNDIVDGIVNPKTDFNYYFLHLVDGENIIKTTSEADVDIEIKYREARRVIL